MRWMALALLGGCFFTRCPEPAPVEVPVAEDLAGTLPSVVEEISGFPIDNHEVEIRTRDTEQTLTLRFRSEGRVVEMEYELGEAL